MLSYDIRQRQAELRGACPCSSAGTATHLQFLRTKAVQGGTSQSNNSLRRGLAWARLAGSWVLSQLSASGRHPSCSAGAAMCQLLQ
jgi:hypothetical protein